MENKDLNNGLGFNGTDLAKQEGVSQTSSDTQSTGGESDNTSKIVDLPETVTIQDINFSNLVLKGGDYISKLVIDDIKTEFKSINTNMNKKNVESLSTGETIQDEKTTFKFEFENVTLLKNKEKRQINVNKNDRSDLIDLLTSSDNVAWLKSVSEGRIDLFANIFKLLYSSNNGLIRRNQISVSLSWISKVIDDVCQSYTNGSSDSKFDNLKLNSRVDLTNINSEQKKLLKSLLFHYNISNGLLPENCSYVKVESAHSFKDLQALIKHSVTYHIVSDQVNSLNLKVMDDSSTIVHISNVLSELLSNLCNQLTKFNHVESSLNDLVARIRSVITKNTQIYDAAQQDALLNNTYFQSFLKDLSFIDLALCTPNIVPSKPSTSWMLNDKLIYEALENSPYIKKLSKFEIVKHFNIGIINDYTNSRRLVVVRPNIAVYKDIKTLRTTYYSDYVKFDDFDEINTITKSVESFNNDILQSLDSKMGTLEMLSHHLNKGEKIGLFAVKSNDLLNNLLALALADAIYIDLEGAETTKKEENKEPSINSLSNLISSNNGAFKFYIRDTSNSRIYEDLVYGLYTRDPNEVIFLNARETQPTMEFKDYNYFIPSTSSLYDDSVRSLMKKGLGAQLDFFMYVPKGKSLKDLNSLVKVKASLNFQELFFPYHNSKDLVYTISNRVLDSVKDGLKLSSKLDDLIKGLGLSDSKMFTRHVNTLVMPDVIRVIQQLGNNPHINALVSKTKVWLSKQSSNIAKSEVTERGASTSQLSYWNNINEELTIFYLKTSMCLYVLQVFQLTDDTTTEAFVAKLTSYLADNYVPGNLINSKELS